MRQARQRAFVGLGSNLQDPVRQVREASIALDAQPETAVINVSRLFRSAPIGPPGQPDYVNAAACLETALSATALLHFLQQIEQRQGRTRSERWGPRTLDLDLLLYDDSIIQSPGLSVPHPRLHERAFVLLPLLDLDAELTVPGRGRADDLLSRISTDDINPLEAWPGGA
jgi:2-amino-4-hydroxy-6-hydroxymethyldihydropteridine diphosphokinase